MTAAAFPVDPSMRCAICHALLDPAADMALLEFTIRKAGQHIPATYRIYACGSLHAAEAMRKTAALVEQKSFNIPAPGASDWPRAVGVLATGKPH
ncbi:MAG: hypothetical protein IPK80_02920 [Nannocystis sp.]|nr:hypothetical protein [Nannocystis sp.]